mgnify:FL=1
MLLSVITINYNGSEKTIKLLNSINSQTDHDFNTLILDNASTKEDFDSLSAWCTKAPIAHLLISSSENLGFGQGINLLTRKAFEKGSDWILVLNNDINLKPDFISLLKPNLTPGNDLVGIPLDEGGHIAYAGKIQWLKHTLQHTYQLTSLPAYEFYAIGGAFAIRKEVFEKLRGFDENYFMYFEDADLSLRAWRKGFKIKFIDKPIAHHPEVSFSGKKLGSPMLLRLHYRNAFYFNLKNGPWYIKLAVWPWSWIVVIKQLIKTGIKQNGEQSIAILNGVVDFYKHRMGQIK